MENCEIQDKVLHSRFDLETHKKTFIDYLEIVISPKGIIHYAIPSHNAILEKIIAKKHKIPREEIAKLCPSEFWYDYQTWLCKESGYIIVWGEPHSNVVGIPNKYQQATLELLKKEKLYISKEDKNERISKFSRTIY